MDELLRIGAVEKNKDKTVKLVKQAYIPQNSEIEKLELVSKHTSDVMGTSIHNIVNDKEQARFQREVVYCDMSEKVVQEFQAYSAKRSMELLVEFNQWLADKNKSEENNLGEKIERVGVGIYFFKEEKDKG